ncbi:MAG: aspartate aminotransferase family protein [Saprospiraceae bacterium]|nr:aspartate aminotransferase family protein [Saprospiraceae bacterium]
MSSNRKLFLDHVAQTSEMALGIEVSHAEGVYIYDINGKRYLDFNSGISVSSLGHCHPRVTDAIHEQSRKYMHTMVYGEHIQEPQVKYASLLAKVLGNGLDSVYFVNSGTEAVEGALKLARKYTNRYEIISCTNAYHGSTIGAESLRSDFEFSRAYLPGVPGVKHIQFNDLEDLKKITTRTACVIMEPVQAEAGVVPPENDYLKAVRHRCDETGTLFILDEIQTGFGRTGYLFAHQKYDVVPDIILLAKAMGGGMPIGAFVAPKHLMETLSRRPALGHITTFGGHPVCTAAALAMLEVITEEDIVCIVLSKEKLILKKLQHPLIKVIRSSGLMMAVELIDSKYLVPVITRIIERGVLVDYFLFNDRSFRIAPPLIITETKIEEATDIILSVLDEIYVANKH